MIAEIENYIDAPSTVPLPLPSIKFSAAVSASAPPTSPDTSCIMMTHLFLTGGDSPHHGDYPGGSRTWVFPGDTKKSR